MKDTCSIPATLRLSETLVPSLVPNLDVRPFFVFLLGVYLDYLCLPASMPPRRTNCKEQRHHVSIEELDPADNLAAFALVDATLPHYIGGLGFRV